MFGDLVLELRAMHENLLAVGPRTDSLPELLAAAAKEIEHLRTIIKDYDRRLDGYVFRDTLNNPS